jgi:hypothetical protein
VARSTQSSGSRFSGSPAAAPSHFTWGVVRSQSAYDYWAPSSHPARGRRGGWRSTPLASDILAPVGEPPRYYTFAWQFLLWLATAALLLMMFV